MIPRSNVLTVTFRSRTSLCRVLCGRNGSLAVGMERRRGSQDDEIHDQVRDAIPVTVSFRDFRNSELVALLRGQSKPETGTGNTPRCTAAIQQRHRSQRTLAY